MKANGDDRRRSSLRALDARAATRLACLCLCLLGIGSSWATTGTTPQTVNVVPVQGALTYPGFWSISASASSGLPLTYTSQTPTVCAFNSVIFPSLATLLNNGTCTVTITQAGNATYAPASTTVTVQSGVIPAIAPQTISFSLTFTGGSLVVGDSGTVAAVATSSLPVTLSSATPSICGVSGSTVTAVKAGTCDVRGTQTGNYAYSAAQADVTFNIKSTSAITPQTGFWWDPSESGRGYVIEIQGATMFMAAFLYAANGEAMWVASTGPMTSPTQYTGSLITYTGGQTLTGAYQAPTLAPSLGTVSIEFTADNQATLTWPGGTVPIQRFSFGSGGASANPPAIVPTGWYWDPSESGRGFAIEVQGNTMYFAAYMYDANGNPTWYLASGQMYAVAPIETPYAGEGADVPQFYLGTWTQYQNGQTMTGPYRAPTLVNGNSLVEAYVDFASATEFELSLSPTGFANALTRFDFGVPAPLTAIEYATVTAAQLSSIVTGPDGNLWFTDLSNNAIGRMTPEGVVTEFTQGISHNAAPRDIVSGSDGNLWFTEAGRIGRITPDGVVTEFTIGLPRAGALPWGIAAGADGNLWFADFSAASIGRITPQGVITEFSLDAGPYPYPTAITSGPDGNMWSYESDTGTIDKITTAGVITRFPLGIAGAQMQGVKFMATGPDGNIWICLYESGQIQRITTAGDLLPAIDLTSYGLQGPVGITVGADGNAWVTETGQTAGASGVVRITPTGVATEYTTGITPYSGPWGITAGPDGAIWFTEPSVGRIGRIPTH